ncbi:hypothetical protein [Bradyrhizobium sp. Bra64]|uniref:hypothetical protein n=1 Tax=Bradyrhizobium sp. Bra64 TaxID=2926009 RepID=UPI002118C53E|nr:hypothetical protein [Bradyrhizobium sp. Bra64]
MKTIDVIIEELKRQDKDGEVFIRLGEDGEPTDDPKFFLVDGNVDLIALAAAVDAARFRPVSQELVDRLNSTGKLPFEVARFASVGEIAVRDYPGALRHPSAMEHKMILAVLSNINPKEPA